MNETDPSFLASPASEDDNEDIDETLLERLYGLTEMFPQSVRSASFSAYKNSIKLVKASYNFGRHSVWITFTSAVVLFGPVWIELERANITREMERQLLLGPRM